MKLEYDSTEGIYTITDSELVGGKVQLIVFEMDPMVTSCFILMRLI